MRLILVASLLSLWSAFVQADNRLGGLAQSLAPGHWLALPAANRLVDVFPDERDHPAWGVLGPRAVVVAWGGGAASDEALYITGGGHSDYGGNEVYGFRFADLTWERLTDPSPYRPECKGICRTLDGTPTSAHTYDGIAWLPAQGRLWVGSGSAYRSGSAVRQAFEFDPDQRRWQAAPSPLVGWLHSAFDPQSGLLLVGSQRGELAAYDPAEQRYRFRSSRSWTLPARVAGLDVDGRQYVVLAGDNKKAWQVLVFDLRSVAWNLPEGRLPGGQLLATRIQRGDGRWVTGAPPGMHRAGISYDTKRRRLTLWDGGPDVWTLDTATWRWTALRAEGVPPSRHDARGRERTRGVFGRWRYLPQWDVFIGYDDPSGSPWLYRPE